MKFSVFLQDPFSFRHLYLLIGGAMLLAAALLRMLIRYLFGTGIRAGAERSVRIGSVRLFFLKLRYSCRIRRIGKAFKNGKIDCREAHQRMSRTVRGFVQKATGVMAEKMVLTEIAQTKHRTLAALIGDMYGPEFARLSDADTLDMVRRSRELIKTWM